MVFMQYDRTQHGRMRSHKLSSDGIQLTSLEMFAVSSYKMGKFGPTHLTIGLIRLNLPRPPTIQSEVVCSRRLSFPPALWRNLGSQLGCLHCRHLAS